MRKTAGSWSGWVNFQHIARSLLEGIKLPSRLHDNRSAQAISTNEIVAPKYVVATQHVKHRTDSSRPDEKQECSLPTQISKTSFLVLPASTIRMRQIDAHDVELRGEKIQLF